MSGTFTPDPSWPTILELATKLWGEPTAWLRGRNEVRFGSRQSKRILIKEMVWQDEDAAGGKAGGGYIDLHQMAIGPLPPRPAANGRGNGRDGDLRPWEHIDTVYAYQAPDGTTILEVVRMAPPFPTRFMQRCRKDKGDGWSWSVRHIPGHDSLLYHAPDIASAASATTIWIVEGEKDADNLARLGMVATCNIGGAGKWRATYAAAFAGRPVVVLPDNDTAGADHALTVARALHGVAASVRVLALPGLEPKGDVSDWLAAGGTRDALEAMAADRHEFVPQPDEAPPQAGRIRTGADFVAGHVPPVWLIDGIIQRSRLYACTSLTGHGKTAVWLFNACMIHAGRMIGQIPTYEGNVLILAGENPADLEARMLGLAKEYDIPGQSLPYVLPGSFPMTEEEIDLLVAEISALGVPFALIVGDTAASFFPGDDENDNVQAGGYARSMRRFSDCPGKPAVVVLCHPIKDAAQNNLLPRGGGAFLNELDGNLVLWSDSIGELTELHWYGKIRGPDFAPFGYRLRQVPTGLIDERNRPEMTVIAEPMSEEEVADHTRQLLQSEDVVLRTLQEHPDWSLAQIARSAGWLNDAGHPMRAKVQHAIRRLEADQMLERLRGNAGRSLTKKGEQIIEKNNRE